MASLVNLQPLQILHLYSGPIEEEVDSTDTTFNLKACNHLPLLFNYMVTTVPLLSNSSLIAAHFRLVGNKHCKQGPRPVSRKLKVA